MNRSTTRTHGEQKQKTRRLLQLLLASVLCATTAFADDYHYQVSHITSKSPEAVWAIIIDYPNICDKGCKYRRPDLVVVKQIDYKKTASSWYTWSHVSTTWKDTRYFTKVTVTRNKKGQIIADNRLLGKNDAKIVKILQSKTGLKHNPAFDKANTHTILTPTADKKTKATFVLDFSATGMLTLWRGRIETSMERGMQQLIKNIGL